MGAGILVLVEGPVSLETDRCLVAVDRVKAWDQSELVSGGLARLVVDLGHHVGGNGNKERQRRSAASGTATTWRPFEIKGFMP